MEVKIFWEAAKKSFLISHVILINQVYKSPTNNDKFLFYIVLKEAMLCT